MKVISSRGWLGMTAKAGISLALLGVVFWKSREQFGAVGNVLSAVRMPDIAFGAAMFCVLILFKALRWRMLINRYGGHLSAKDCFVAYMGGVALGAATPGRIGEFSRAYAVQSRGGLPLREAIITVMTDRMYDLVTLLVLGGCGWMYVVVHLPPGWLPLAIACCLILCVGGARLTQAIGARIRERVTSPALAGLLRFVEEPLRLMNFKQPGLWAYTILAYAVYFAASWYVVDLAGVRVGLLSVCAIVGFASLVVLLPVSIAGLGTRELVFVTMFCQLGVDRGNALAASLLHFGLFFGVGSAMGAAMFLVMPAGSTRAGKRLVEIVSAEESAAEREQRK